METLKKFWNFIYEIWPTKNFKSGSLPNFLFVWPKTTIKTNKFKHRWYDADPDPSKIHRLLPLINVENYSCLALNSFTAREKIEPEIERRSRQNSNGMPLKFLAGKSRKDETFLASHTVNAEPYGLKNARPPGGLE